MPDICLIYPPQIELREPLAYPPLGLLYIASNLIENDFKVNLINASDEVNDKWFYNDLSDVSYVGITVTSPNLHKVKNIVKKIKAMYSSIKIILGGPHCAAMPEQTLKETGANYVVDGEGEYAILDILNGKVNEGVVESSRIYNLDRLKFPARHLMAKGLFNETGVYAARGLKATTLITSRGCPYRCSFCCKTRVTDGVRYHSPSYIVEELDALYQDYQCSNFRILDDAFSVDQVRLVELCEMLVNRKYNLHVILRADSIQDIEIIKLMRAAGVNEINMGVESADPEVLKIVNKRETIEEIETALSLCRQAGIMTKVFLIEGLPGETSQSIALTKQFMQRCKPDAYTLSKFTPLPGSDIWKHPEKYDIKKPSQSEWFYPDVNKSDLRLWLGSGVWKQ